MGQHLTDTAIKSEGEQKLAEFQTMQRLGKNMKKTVPNSAENV
jgi:hypothetical protein